MNRVLLHASPSRQKHGVRLQRLARVFLTRLRLDGVELSLALVGDARIRSLNREWRAKDTATDVLSFPAGDSPGPGLKPLGDVIISVDTARRAAREWGSTFDAELDRYLAHGLLHLLGEDHVRRADAVRMARRERFLLGRDGMLGGP